MFADQAAEAGYAVVRIAGHDVRPNSESFLQAAGPGAGLGPVVVLVDTTNCLSLLLTGCARISCLVSRTARRW